MRGIDPPVLATFEDRKRQPPTFGLSEYLNPLGNSDIQTWPCGDRRVLNKAFRPRARQRRKEATSTISGGLPRILRRRAFLGLVEQAGGFLGGNDAGGGGGLPKIDDGGGVRRQAVKKPRLGRFELGRWPPFATRSVSLGIGRRR